MDENIQSLYGNDEILKSTLEILDSTRETIEGCIGKEEVEMHVSHETLWNALTALKHKGVKIRIVTQVTSDNLEFCKKFTEAVELKHLDGIQSSFGISDGKWLLEHVVSLDEYPLSHAILTDIRKLVGIKRKLFETLWKQSVPAEEIFMKLELLNPAEVNTKIESNEAEKPLFNLISNSKYRIDMVIRTNDSVNLLELGRLSRCLKDALNQGVKIRILLPKGELNDLDNLGVNLKRVKKNQSNKLILVVDNLHTLVGEINEFRENDLELTIRNAVHSTSTLSLMTFSALFEKMWRSA